MRLAALLTVASLSLGAFADTFYVSSAGDDANPGTIDAPVQRLSRGIALSLATDGADAVLLKRGEVFGGGTFQSNKPGRLDGLRIGAYGKGPLPVVRAQNGIKFMNGIINGLIIEDLRIEGVPSNVADTTTYGDGLSVLCKYLPDGTNGRAENLTVRRLVVTGFRNGLYLQFVHNLVVEDCLVAYCVGQGALLGKIDSLRMSGSAFLFDGWLAGVKERMIDKSHGVYVSDTVNDVRIDRCAFVYACYYGWKAEMGGEVNDSLFVGNPVHVGPGPNGAGQEFPDYVRADHQLVIRRTVLGMAMDTPFAPRAYAVAVVSPTGIGLLRVEDSVVGPPVTSNGRAIASPWRTDGVTDDTQIVNTVVQGYGADIPTATVAPAWASEATWRTKTSAWLQAGVMNGAVIDSERDAAWAVLTGAEPVPAPEPTPEPTPEPVPWVATLTATGGAPFTVVTENGDLVSRHTSMHKAIQTGEEYLAEHPGESRVYIRMELRVDR